MIPITKEERALILELFPEERCPRTMVHDSHRHHYYCTESEKLMRVIASTNDRAAELVAEFDRQKVLNKARLEAERGS